MSRRYQLRLQVSAFGPDDLTEANDFFEDNLDTVIEDADLLLLDVQVLPREAGGSDDLPREELMRTMGQLEPPSVTHPWDQGLNIFPEGHILHDVEVAAKKHYERVVHESPEYAAGLKQGMLEAGQKNYMQLDP